MKKIALLASVLVVLSPNISNAQNFNYPASMKHKLSVDGGLMFARGNTKADNLNANFNLESTKGKFTNNLMGRAINLKQNSQRADEDYLLNNKLKYDLSEKTYGFGELEYFNDRFAGFEHRMHELAGLGYYIRNDDKVKLSVEGGGGARQTNFTGNKEDINEFVAKAGGDLNYVLNENVEFNQNVGYYWGSDLQVTRSQTSLKADLIDDVYFKAGYLIENNSEVPIGRKNNDQLTTIGIGYEFASE
ncbi:MAG: DUF481 domain-containing protein [Rickettsiales bacterium]|nr:DUF481 domain-containing protein [Rickettsiales bacterium]